MAEPLESADLARSVSEVARYWHEDPYYERAEQPDWLSAFWTANLAHRPFRDLFSLLNLRATLELACGYGRHANQIYDKVPALVLMDVVAENVEFCRQRFASADNVVVVQNDGSTFRPVPDSSLSAIYCYDAMVHFEYDVVLSYVKDAGRVLEKGGRALFHHSILATFPGRDHRLNPGGRNFMSHDLLLHAVRKAGMEIIDTRTFDWDAPHTDGLTLFEKR